MSTLLIAVASFVGFIVAYHTYGRWLARKVFGLDADAIVPSQELQDNIDFIPTKKEVIFGHHFTSIAGTGPIVGPAIAVFWGWLPALLWVVFGSIFVGAVHDFGALVVSLRNRGQTLGEVTGRIISKRAKILFLVILFFALTIVLAIFGLVIASIFMIYPQSVLSVWIEIPIAVAIGIWVYKKNGTLLVPSVLALVAMYVCIYIGVYFFPIELSVENPVVVWTVVLMTYCFIASVLPVWTLMQPRDFINSHQLVIALGLLVLGLLVAGMTGKADVVDSTPAVVAAANLPADAPPMLPFLFITIACGAVSGFHCLVSSGTSSKQVASESDAQYVGYGAMLLEGALAVIVILACTAGIGMGMSKGGETIAGRAAWENVYQAKITEVTDATTGETKKVGGWKNHTLGRKVGAFIDGGANFLTAIWIPRQLGIGIVAVLVASFAATTLDTATRLQRYVVQELLHSIHLSPLANKYFATAVPLSLAFLVALTKGPSGKMGTGGLFLWPLFGATNQLLAGLAFLVTVFYLWRRGKPIWFAAAPMALMLAMPAWAMGWKLLNRTDGWLGFGETPFNPLLASFGLFILGLQIWIVVEAILIWPKAKGVLEEALPPLERGIAGEMAGGRSC